MKAVILRKLPKNLEQLMRAKNLTAKELAQKSKISYSSLMPILSGNRECSISKLIAISETLGCTPDTLLKDLFSPVDKSFSENNMPSDRPKFLAVFISVVKVTYCLLHDTETGVTKESVQQFPLRIEDGPEFLISNIIATLEKFSQDLKKHIEPKEVAVFASVQQYGRKTNREKTQSKGDHLFAKFIMEADAYSNHNAFIGKQNGICVSVNDGCMITYNLDHGKVINRLQGYGFPVSDTAGNYWIGCEAIRHVVNVKEQREPGTLLSDRLLASFDSDIMLMCASALEVPHATFLKASNMVKELLQQEQKAYGIFKRSADLLLVDIATIDTLAKAKLPIFISGELAYFYEGFFPKERLIEIKERQNDVLLRYGLEKLKA